MSSERQSSKQSSIVTPATGATLQRQCACGQHTAGGGECAACKQKRSTAARGTTLQRSHSSLAISRPGDRYEQEADRVAATVTSGGALPELVLSSVPTMQRGASGDSDLSVAPPIVHDVLGSPGQPLDAATRAYMEPRLGHDFSGVRLHTDGRAAESAQAVQANAYTVGNHIAFDAGRHAPGTGAGQRLLAHELAHVVQQSGSDGIRAGQGDGAGGLAPISDTLVQRAGGSNTTPQVPAWLRGVNIVRHLSGLVFEIDINGYGRTLVGPYNQLINQNHCMKQENAHHIVGGEHLLDVSTGYSYPDAPCVCIDNGIHNKISEAITKEQRELGGRRGGRATVTKEEVAGLYREVYTFYTNFIELARIAGNVLGVPLKPQAARRQFSDDQSRALNDLELAIGSAIKKPGDPAIGAQDAVWHSINRLDMTDMLIVLEEAHRRGKLTVLDQSLNRAEGVGVWRIRTAMLAVEIKKMRQAGMRETKLELALKASVFAELLAKLPKPQVTTIQEYLKPPETKSEKQETSQDKSNKKKKSDTPKPEASEETKGSGIGEMIKKALVAAGVVTAGAAALEFAGSALLGLAEAIATDLFRKVILRAVVEGLKQPAKQIVKEVVKDALIEQGPKFRINITPQQAEKVAEYTANEFEHFAENAERIIGR
jgi:hypothetical protein